MLGLCGGAWLACGAWAAPAAGPAALMSTPLPRSAAVGGYYERVAYALPAESKFEVSGLAARPDGTLAIALRKGEVWILENPTDDPAAARYHRFASGLHEPLGLTWHQGALYTTQRSEVTRLEDHDGNDVADTYVTVAKGWGISGNYHEYAYGPVFDREGNLWATLNVTIGQGAKLAGNRQGAPRWRGWAVRQTPNGELEPVTAGFRSPFGLGLNAEGDVFATDQQGNWVGTGPLIHVQPGQFHGHADSLPDLRRPGSRVPDPGLLPEGITVAEAAKRVPGYALPAVWFPYVKMGQSATGIRCDLTDGRFGPFARQVFVGEFTLSQINRVFLEKVEGEYQGACFPFLDGMQSAVLQMEFLADGSMVAGESNRGWNSLGTRSYGLERVRWTGRVPFELEKVEARADGFRLTFTEPVAQPGRVSAGDFTLSSYTYLYHSAYGSPETDTKPVAVTGVEVGDDGRTVVVRCEGLREGYVHELRLGALTSVSGQPLRYDRAYYTLNRRPSAR